MSTRILLGTGSAGKTIRETLVSPVVVLRDQVLEDDRAHLVECDVEGRSTRVDADAPLQLPDQHWDHAYEREDPPQGRRILDWSVGLREVATAPILATSMMGTLSLLCKSLEPTPLFGSRPSCTGCRSPRTHRHPTSSR